MSYGSFDQYDLYRISVTDNLSIFTNKNYRYETDYDILSFVYNTFSYMVYFKDLKPMLF